MASNTNRDRRPRSTGMPQRSARRGAAEPVSGAGGCPRAPALDMADIPCWSWDPPDLPQRGSTMNNQLPYIPDDVGVPILCQPYVFSDSKMAVFFLDSQAAALNGLLDTYINGPSGGQYEYVALAAG